MAKKILLDNRPGPSRFTFFGISCHLRDYQLTFQVNSTIDLEFVKEDDFQGYSFFYCRDENGFNSYILIGNRGPESVLVPEMKQTDYLLLIEGPVRKAQKEKLVKNILRIEHVLAAWEVNPGQIRNVEVLLGDLEFHCVNIHKDQKATYTPSKK